MDIIISIPFLAILVLLIYKTRMFDFSGIQRKTLVLLFLFKVIAGFCLLLIYTYYYTDRSTGDVFNYFDDGNILFGALKSNPKDYFRMLTGIGSDSPHLMKYYNSMGFWLKEFDYDLYNDNRTVIRLNAFIRIFSFGSIYVHTIFFSFLSFIGLLCMYQVAKQFVKTNKYLLMFSVFLIPSVVFWTSGVLKEAILMFGFGIFLFSVIAIIQKKSIFKNWMLLIFSLCVLFLVKFYILIAAIPGIFTILLLHYSGMRYGFLKFLAVHLFTFLILINSQYIIGYDFLGIMANKQQDFITFVESLENVGSKIEIPKLEPTVISLIKNSPVAIYNTLFRPFIWEAGSLTALLGALENLLIVLLILLSILLRRKSYSINAFVCFSISFTLVVFLLGGLTTPVLGALVRYKAPALPFLFFILLDIANTEKIKSTYLKLRSKWIT